MSRTADGITFWIAMLACLGAVGCGGGSSTASRAAGTDVPYAVVGRQPISEVHLFENHSSALIAWRAADVRDRVLLHIDGHSDLDWLPDETVARIAAATSGELREYELHPYAMDGETMRRFAIWNFVYPSVRLGLVREFIWVVPDGTLIDAASAFRLAREMIVDKLERVGLEEASGLRLEGRLVRGEVLGIPWTACELADLPPIAEPVLLDVDLDYFTTRSATTQHVTEAPWIDPDQILGLLEAREIRTDIATVSLSTIGGYLPPSQRWLGKYLVDRLRDPEAQRSAVEDIRREAIELAAAGDGAGAEDRIRALLERAPDDSCGWYCLSRIERASGRTTRADTSLRLAVRGDPLLIHESLFEGDRLWLNGEFDGALEMYRRYAEELPDSRFGAYALRRKAGCLMRLGRDDEAIESYEAVVRLAPDHADSLLDLGILYRERGDLDRALELLERARTAMPQRSTFALALGTTLLMAERFGEGAVELESAVEFKPTSVRARGNLATALIELGRYREAAGHVRIALSLQPRNPRIRQLARIIVQNGVDLTDP